MKEKLGKIDLAFVKFYLFYVNIFLIFKENLVNFLGGKLMYNKVNINIIIEVKNLKSCLYIFTQPLCHRQDMIQVE